MAGGFCCLSPGCVPPPVHLQCIPTGGQGGSGVLDAEPLCAPLLGAARWAGSLMLARRASFTKLVNKWRKTHKVQRKPGEAAPEAAPFLAEPFPYPELSSPPAGAPAKAPRVPLPCRDTGTSAIWADNRHHHGPGVSSVGQAGAAMCLPGGQATVCASAGHRPPGSVVWRLMPVFLGRSLPFC